jgi:glycosyltransferase involved in cell wall biosynthesis
MDLVFKDVSRFDVIHFHCDYLHFPLLDRHNCRSVTTLHGSLHIPDFGPLLAAHPHIPLVSISNNQRLPMLHANWRATVYHGLPGDLYTYQDEPGRYLAFLGRMSPEKGVDRAIEVAQRAQIELRIAAKIYPEELAYFKEKIAPMLRSAKRWVEFIGEVGGEEKDRFLGRAKALLFPVNWQEPFGMVMIESLACGTPVIGWRNGSVPEVISDGRTGYIVESVDAAVRAVERVGSLKRRDCRVEFDQRFDAGRMAKEYLEVYRQLPESTARTASRVAAARDHRCA